MICDMRKLTPKQQKFADRYIETGNGIQSAIYAGYSERSANAIASENLRKPYISEYIRKRLEEHSFESEIRQRQALDYAIRVLNEEETEESALTVHNGEYEEVAIAKTKPKIKDRTDAARFITTLTSTVERNRLQNQKLQQEIKKLKKELEAGSSTEDKLEEYFNMLDGEFDDATE